MTFQRKLMMFGVLAAFLLAFGAASGLTGRDVLATERALRDADLRFFGGDVPPDAWAPVGVAPWDAADRFLATEDDRMAREAAWLFRESHRDDLNLAARGEFRRRTQESLRALLRDAVNDAVRSYAANLLGILYVEEAMADQEHAAEFVSASAGLFQQAAWLDSTHEDARRNLELLLWLIERGEAPGQGDASGEEGSSSGLDLPDEGEGAGIGSSGHGY